MADTLKNLYKGTLGTGVVTLYTVPALTKTILKEIVLCNKTATDATATILLDGVNIIWSKTIPKNDTYVIEFHSIIEPNKAIIGYSGTVGAIDIYISGIEVA